jgi:hypothetical protein
MKRWLLVLIAFPAAVAVWSGWVGLGSLCGFGIIRPLPGIAGGFRLDTAITLPVGVEAYGAYALGAWLAPGGVPATARLFARRSAIGALALGMAGQVIYHLLAAAHATRAPWPVVVLVSCMPVVTLGFGAALTHLLRAAGAPVPPGRVTVPPAPRERAAVPPVGRPALSTERPFRDGPVRVPARLATAPGRAGPRAARAAGPPDGADRGSLGAARAAYRASIQRGEPMSARALASAHGISRRQAANVVGAETGPPLAVVGEGAAR